MSSTTAASTRHLHTLYQGDPCRKWAALYYGHQPRPRRPYRRSGRFLHIHLTPIHFARDRCNVEFGLCWGRRTVYVLRHR